MCACSVDGRSGSFTYRFEGSGASVISAFSGTFENLYGDGGLATLHGHGTFDGPLYTFDYHFDPT